MIREITIVKTDLTFPGRGTRFIIRLSRSKSGVFNASIKYILVFSSKRKICIKNILTQNSLKKNEN